MSHDLFFTGRRFGWDSETHWLWGWLARQPFRRYRRIISCHRRKYSLVNCQLFPYSKGKIALVEHLAAAVIPFKKCSSATNARIKLSLNFSSAMCSLLHACNAQVGLALAPAPTRPFSGLAVSRAGKSLCERFRAGNPIFPG